MVAALAFIGLAGAALRWLATPGDPRWPSYAGAVAALAGAGVAAAVLGARLPPAVIGLLGLIPLLRGVRQLLALRDLPRRAALADAAAVYLPLLAGRALGELAAASAVLLGVAGLGELVALAAPAWRGHRGAAGVSSWAMIAVGLALVVEGRAWSWFLP